MAGLTGLESCGEYLCGSRLRPRGLAVYDLNAQEGVELMGQTLTFGVGWDLAILKNRAYVAHGILGVGVYDVSDPVAPAWRDQVLWTGGRVTTVAARRNLVAAGRKDGTVILFSTDGGDSMEEEARFEALGRIERLQFQELAGEE